MMRYDSDRNLSFQDFIIMSALGVMHVILGRARGMACLRDCDQSLACSNLEAMQFFPLSQGKLV